MPKCKICNQDADLLYWLFEGRKCVGCKCTLDKLTHPVNLTPEIIERMNISERKATEYYKKYFQHSSNFR